MHPKSTVNFPERNVVLYELYKTWKIFFRADIEQEFGSVGRRRGTRKRLKRMSWAPCQELWQGPSRFHPLTQARPELKFYEGHLWLAGRSHSPCDGWFLEQTFMAKSQHDCTPVHTVQCMFTTWNACKFLFCCLDMCIHWTTAVLLAHNHWQYGHLFFISFSSHSSSQPVQSKDLIQSCISWSGNFTRSHWCYNNGWLEPLLNII